jgi:hypothetical protein
LFTLPAIAALHSISPAKITGKNHWQKSLVRPAACRPPSILDLSPVLDPVALSALCVRFRTSEATLYARKPRRLSDPSASRRYPHIAPPPQMFQLCSLQSHVARAEFTTQLYGDLSLPQLSLGNAKMEPKVPPANGNNVYRSSACPILGSWVLQFGDAIFARVAL